jgi:hypothetical protein
VSVAETRALDRSVFCAGWGDVPSGNGTQPSTADQAMVEEDMGVGIVPLQSVKGRSRKRKN